MCFYNDYDWTAGYSENGSVVLERDRRCIECGTLLATGSTVRRIYLREYEECQVCDDAGCEGECDYGEEDESFFCDNCEKMRRAVNDLETKEGCPWDSREPMVGNLWDAIAETEPEKYVAHALSMFPELAGFKYLERVSRQ